MFCSKCYCHDDAISSRVVFGLLTLKYFQLLLLILILTHYSCFLKIEMRTLINTFSIFLLKKDLNLQCMIVQKCKIKLFKVFVIEHFLSLQLERYLLFPIFWIHYILIAVNLVFLYFQLAINLIITINPLTEIVYKANGLQS